MEENKQCTHEGLTYQEGDERCYIRFCFVCRQGEWVKKQVRP